MKDLHMIVLIITEDMNAKVGDRNWDFERVLCKQGLGVRNDNCERLYKMFDINE